MKPNPNSDIYFLNYSALVAILIDSISNICNSASNLNIKKNDVISFLLAVTLFNSFQRRLGFCSSILKQFNISLLWKYVERLHHISSLFFVIFPLAPPADVFIMMNKRTHKKLRNEYHFNSIHIGFSTYNSKKKWNRNFCMNTTVWNVEY